MIEIEDTRYMREKQDVCLLSAANADLRGATILPFSGQLRAGARLDEAWCAVVDCSQLDRATGPNVSVPLTVCDWHATTLITEPYLGVTIFLL